MKREDIRFHYFEGVKSKPELEKIKKDLIDEMPNHGVEEYFRFKGNMLSDSDSVIVSSYAGKYLGIMVLSNIELSKSKWGVYIRTLLVSEKYHRLNLAYDLVCNGFQFHCAVKKSFPDYIFMTTYNPITYRMMKDFTVSNNKNVFLYPSLNSQPDENTKKVAYKISKAINPDCEFDADNGVVLLGGGKIPATFWKNYPTTRDEHVMNYFKSNVGDNDRLLCVIFCESLIDKEIISKNLNIKGEIYAAG